MQQGKPKPVPEHEDIILPDAIPRWPTMQLQPNRQNCDHETYVPACARREGARFVSQLLYDIPVCRPCMLFSISSRIHRFCTPASGEWGSCRGSPNSWAQLYCLDFNGPYHDSELLWCCQLLVPTVSLIPQAPR